MSGDAAVERNRRAFGAASTVDDYSATDGLTPAEEHLVERWAPPSPRVLDLGVGTGRTTRRLAAMARTYVGIDITPGMIERARRLHPGVDLRLGDASDLTEFEAGSFDLVVFSYHGIDYLHPDRSRQRCLAEVARVLRPGGVFLASRHNPRSLWRRPRRPLTARTIAVAAYQSARLVARRVREPSFRRGEGYLLDPVRGGLVTHAAVPPKVVAEAADAGLRHLDTIPTDHPARPNRFVSSWYYAFERRPDEATTVP